MAHVPFKTKGEDAPGIYPPLGLLLRKKATKGSIGLEIECEGNKFKKEFLPGQWAYHQDNSLRGQDNAEYVLVRPIEFDKVPEALDSLWGMFADYGTVLADSNRTSVHVHLNVQDWYLNRLTSFLAMYFCVEELLTAWCGEHRIGNLFCLRAKDAPAIVSQLRKFVRRNGNYQIPDGFHYAGLNAQALFKFGSIEIRTLRGPTDKQVILDWVAMLERLYKLSAEYDDPRDICGLFSADGPLNFLGSIFGPTETILRNGISYTDDMIRDAMYYGIRMVQDLVYCRDWSAYKPTVIKPDPFQRDPLKVFEQATAPQAASLMNFNAVLQTIEGHHYPTYPTTLAEASVLTISEALPPSPEPDVESFDLPLTIEDLDFAINHFDDPPQD